MASVESAGLIFPTEQNRLLIASFAAFNGSPTTFGTTHGRSAKVAPTLTWSPTTSLHLPVPVQAPVHRTNLEPFAYAQNRYQVVAVGRLDLPVQKFV